MPSLHVINRQDKIVLGKDRSSNTFNLPVLPVEDFLHKFRELLLKNKMLLKSDPVLIAGKCNLLACL